MAIHDDGPISLERAETLLRSAQVLHGESEAVKGQAIRFLEWTNVISITNDRVDFSLRPLLECACAPVLLERLAAGESILAKYWRIVAFATAIARQRAQVDSLRPALLGFLGAHKDVAGWFLAACYVVGESRDASLAKEIVAWRAQQAFERPLLSIAAERRTSAATVAMTIHLAGDEGFEWFYSAYLDPRFPILHRGSGILENIFEHWVGLKESPSAREVVLLQAFSAGHLAADGPARHKLVPLALLLSPGAIEPFQHASLLARLLTHSLMSIRAEVQLRKLMSVHPKEVREALWSYILVGHENAAKAGSLWLEGLASDELPPLQLISVALRARGNWQGRYHSQALWDALVDRLGTATWERFCRWHLSESEAGHAIGAATYLIARHPPLATDFRDILLRALHDGNRNPEAEPILAQLAQQNPIVVARWLARRISEYHDLWGAPSSWWRLFLPLLEHLGEGGPSLLASALGRLSAFTLSRNADIRRVVRKLGGANQRAYVEMLEEKLRRGTSPQRFGAAQMLICLGASTGEALLGCARARLDHLNRSEEWSQYCLSQSLPPAAIDHVLAARDRLPKESKLFVLGLTVANGRELSEGDLRFVAENTQRLYSVPPLAELLARESVFEHLKRLTLDARLGTAIDAAMALIERHASRLDRVTRIRCEVLAGVNVGAARFLEFETDDSARSEVIACGNQLLTEYGQRFVLAALAEASLDPTKWLDATRMLIRSERLPGDNEATAWELLRIGKEHPRHASSIGEAARDLLAAGSRENTKALREEALWLMFLAHEFGAVDSAYLAERIQPHLREVHLSSICTALIARIPAFEPAPMERPGLPPSGAAASSLDEMSALDPNDPSLALCSVIPGTLYQQYDRMDFERVAARGTRPGLIAALLQYLSDMPLDPKWIRQILGSEWLHSNIANKCAARLRELLVLAFRRLSREQSEETRSLLRSEISAGGDDGLDAAMLLKSVDCVLTVEELAAVVLRFGEIPYQGWRSVLRLIADEAVRLADELRASEVFRRATLHSLEELAAHPPDMQRDPLALVVYACLAWLSDARSEHTDTLFRHGVAGLASGDQSQRGADALAEVVELLKRIDPQCIRAAMTQSEGDESSIVAVGLLLSSFLPSAT